MSDEPPPRTDAEAIEDTGLDSPIYGYVDADFARELERENARLREALKDCLHFISAVGTEDPDDIETMAEIEGLSGRITSLIDVEQAKT